MWFQRYDGTYLDSESQIDFSRDPQKSEVHYPPNGKVFEVDDYSFDVEQTLNIGSRSAGSGAGKVTFNPFRITRKTDKSSPVFFQMACSGTPFQTVALVLRNRRAVRRRVSHSLSSPSSWWLSKPLPGQGPPTRKRKP